MPRSIWKGPYVDYSLVKKTEKESNKPIKTWSRNSTIIPQFIGFVFQIHTGRRFITVKVTEDMVGHKLGEFATTRSLYGQGIKNKKR